MAALQKKSTVTSISSNGDFKGKHGVVYKFNIEFKNGDKGEFTTNKAAQTKFVEGEKVEYTIEELTLQTSRGPWKKIKIDKVKELGGRQYSNYNDPETQARIIRSVALECAIKCQKFKLEEFSVLTDLADYFCWWVNTKGGANDQNISAQAALIRAILAYEEAGKSPESLEKLTKNANFFYNYIITPKSDKEEENE